MVVPSAINNGTGDGLLSAVDDVAGSEADNSGGAALEAGSDGEAGAACGFFPDGKKGVAVEAVAGDGTSAVVVKE